MAQRPTETTTETGVATTAAVEYTSPSGGKTRLAFGYTPTSTNVSTYSSLSSTDPVTGEKESSDVMVESFSESTSILAQVNPQICTGYLENGISINGYILSVATTVKTITYEQGKDGPRAVRDEEKQYLSEIAFAGGIGIPASAYVVNGTPVNLTNARIHTSTLVNDYYVDEMAGTTKVVTSRYLAQGLTTEGKSSFAKRADDANTTDDVIAAIADAAFLVFDGISVRNVIGRDYGVEKRSSDQSKTASNIGGSSNQSVSVEFSLGRPPSDGFDPSDGGDPSALQPNDPMPGDTWTDPQGVSFIWDGSQWVPITETDPVKPAIGDTWTSPVTSLEYMWDGTQWLLYTSTAPSSPQAGDSYISSSSGLKYIWNGSAWAPYIRDGEGWTSYTSTAPTDPAVGDAYINPRNGDKYTWDGSQWIRSIKEGDRWTPILSTAPSTPTAGDAYIDSASGLKYVWDGSTWIAYIDDGGWVLYTSTAPSSPEAGDEYISPETGLKYVREGTEWVAYIKDGGQWVPYTSTAPSSPGVGDEYIDPGTGYKYEWDGAEWLVYIKYKGDWVPFNTEIPDNLVYEFEGGEWVPYIWDGTQWVIYTKTAPASPSAGDEYIDPSDDLKYVWNGTEWIPYIKDGDDWLLYSPSRPLSPEVGDQTISSSTGIKYVWNGSGWIPYIRDGDSWLLYTPDQPASPEPGDAYINPRNGNKYEWNGTEWVTYVNDGGEWVPILDAAPGSPALGDAYISEGQGFKWVWNGSAWVSYVQDGGWVLYTSTPPSDPEEGDQYIDPTTFLKYVREGGAWISYKRPDRQWLLYLPEPPDTPEPGDQYINSINEFIYEWTGTEWVTDALPTDTAGPPEFIDGQWIPVGAPSNPRVGEVYSSPGATYDFYWNGRKWLPYTSTPPPDPNTGDRYVNSATDIGYEWDGDSWEIDDPPPFPSEGNVWRNVITGIKYEWNGEEWIQLPIEPAPDPINGDYTPPGWTGNEWVPSATVPPSSPDLGDQYYNPTTVEFFQWDGTRWAPRTATPPSSPAPGDVYIDPATDIGYEWDGDSWESYITMPPRPATPPNVGDTYINPATGDEYQWDGESWELTDNNFGSTPDSDLDPDPDSGVPGDIIDVPYPNDDVIVTVPNEDGDLEDWLVPGGADQQALALAEVENALRYGHAYGANITLEAWNLPTTPLAPYTVRAGGLEVQYLADGCSWEWNDQALVVSCDGIYVGVTGRIDGEPLTPWVPAVVSLSSLPTVGAPTVSSTAVPANTIPLPAGFSPSQPGGIWNLLPTNGSDTFEESATPAVVVAPYNMREIETSILRAVVMEVEVPYSLVPVDEGSEVLAAKSVLIDDGDDVLLAKAIAEETESGAISAGTIVVGSITYSQSSLWSANTVASNAGMTDGSWNTGTETGTDPGMGTTSWIQMDLGSVCTIANVIIGCDFDTVLPDGWGPDYAENCLVEVSTDGTTWTTLFTTGVFTSAIETFPVSAIGRYIRINGRPEYDGYMAITEFYATST